MTHAFDRDGKTITAICSRCESDRMRPPHGYRLWLCMSCGTATDGPTLRDARGLEVVWSDDGADLIHVA